MEVRQNKTGNTFLSKKFGYGRFTNHIIQYPLWLEKVSSLKIVVEKGNLLIGESVYLRLTDS